MRKSVRYAVILAILIAGCQKGPQPAPAIGEAYVGPAMLNLRQEIALTSPVVAAVSHGEKLEIVQRRRRFVKVRTPRKAEGWIEERLLLTPDEVGNLRRLSEQSKAAPSQGVATTYDSLNVHIVPDRQSPSFLAINPGDKVDVIGHRVAPRSSPAPPRVRTPARSKVKAKKKKEDKKLAAIPPPPPPAAPKLPDDWLQLSASPSEGPPVAPPERKPEPADDWSLVRNSEGKAGWVMTRRLFMAIPDEVAQYAEGRRIASYFSLGEIQDNEKTKNIWLWTTIERSQLPYDFDSFRVFVWSLRHHRYETAHIERNLKGYAPVLLHSVATPKSLKSKSAGQEGDKLPGFSILLEKKDGLRYRRSYALLGNIVRFSGEQRVSESESVEPSSAAPDLVASSKPENTAREESFYIRVRKLLFGR